MTTRTPLSKPLALFVSIVLPSLAPADRRWDRTRSGPGSWLGTWAHSIAIIIYHLGLYGVCQFMLSVWLTWALSRPNVESDLDDAIGFWYRPLCSLVTAFVMLVVVSSTGVSLSLCGSRGLRLRRQSPVVRIVGAIAAFQGFLGLVGIVLGCAEAWIRPDHPPLAGDWGLSKEDPEEFGPGEEVSMKPRLAFLAMSSSALFQGVATIFALVVLLGYPAPELALPKRLEPTIPDEQRARDSPEGIHLDDVNGAAPAQGLLARQFASQQMRAGRFRYTKSGAAEATTVEVTISRPNPQQGEGSSAGDTIPADPNQHEPPNESPLPLMRFGPATLYWTYYERETTKEGHRESSNPTSDIRRIVLTRFVLWHCLLVPLSVIVHIVCLAFTLKWDNKCGWYAASDGSIHDHERSC